MDDLPTEVPDNLASGLFLDRKVTLLRKFISCLLSDASRAVQVERRNLQLIFSLWAIKKQTLIEPIYMDAIQCMVGEEEMLLVAISERKEVHFLESRRTIRAELAMLFCKKCKTTVNMVVMYSLLGR